MSNDQSDYEDYLRKKLYDFEMEPSEKVWEGIEKNLNTNNFGGAGPAGRTGNRFLPKAMGGLSLIFIITIASIRILNKDFFKESTTLTTGLTKKSQINNARKGLTRDEPGTFYYNNDDLPVYPNSEEDLSSLKVPASYLVEESFNASDTETRSDESLIKNKKNPNTAKTLQKSKSLSSTLEKERYSKGKGDYIGRLTIDGNTTEASESSRTLKTSTGRDRSFTKGSSGPIKKAARKGSSSKQVGSFEKKEPINEDASFDLHTHANLSSNRMKKENVGSTTMSTKQPLKSNDSNEISNRKEKGISSQHSSDGSTSITSKQPFYTADSDESVNTIEKDRLPHQSNDKIAAEKTFNSDQKLSNKNYVSAQNDNDGKIDITPSKDGFEENKSEGGQSKSNLSSENDMLGNRSFVKSDNAANNVNNQSHVFTRNTESVTGIGEKDTTVNNKPIIAISEKNIKDTLSKDNVDEVKGKKKSTSNKGGSAVNTSLDFFVSPEISHRSISLIGASPQADEDLAFRKNNEHPKSAISIGSTVNFHFSEKLAFKTGVVYSNYGEKISHNYESRRTRVDSIETLRIDSTLVRDTFGLIYIYDTLRFYDRREMIEMNNGNYSFKTSYNFINIPVAFSFTIRPQKALCFQITGGVNVAIFLGGSGMVKLDSSRYELRKFKASDAPFRPVGLSLLVNPIASYAISETVRITLGPVAKYFLTSIYKKDELFDFRPYSVGVQAGVQIKF